LDVGFLGAHHWEVERIQPGVSDKDEPIEGVKICTIDTRILLGHLSFKFHHAVSTEENWALHGKWETGDVTIDDEAIHERVVSISEDAERPEFCRVEVAPKRDLTSALIAILLFAQVSLHRETDLISTIIPGFG